MSLADQVLKSTQLINRRVIERNSADDVGFIEHLWLDAKAQKVVGFNTKVGLLGRNKTGFRWEEIEQIGENILVNRTSKQVDVEKPEGVITTLNHEICTDSGKVAGKLVDYVVVVSTGMVLNYLFSSSGWRGVLDGIYVLSPAAIQSFGTKRIIVSEIAVLNPELYAEGLQQKISHAADFAQKDYEKTIDHWQNLKERTQTGVEGLKRGAQQLAEELQEKTQDVKERVEDIAEDTRERVTDLQNKLKKETPPIAPEKISPPANPADNEH